MAHRSRISTTFAVAGIFTDLVSHSTRNLLGLAARPAAGLTLGPPANRRSSGAEKDDFGPDPADFVNATFMLDSAIVFAVFRRWRGWAQTVGGVWSGRGGQGAAIRATFPGSPRCRILRPVRQRRTLRISDLRQWVLLSHLQPAGNSRSVFRAVCCH